MIPHLLHVFPNFGIGGMPLRTVRIMNYFGTSCRHMVISLDGITAAAEQIGKNVSVEILPMLVDKRQPIGNLLRFRRFLAEVKPNLLATYNWGAIEWAGVHFVRPLCRHIHFEAGFGREEARRQFRRRVFARRIVLAKSESIVVPSRTLERIALDIWGIPEDRVRYIPDGIDIVRFTKRRYDVERPREQIVVGTVAPLRPEKNVGRLIDAFSVLASDPRFRLVIAGDGPERATLEGLVKRQGLSHRINFLGHVPDPERILPTFDIFGVSSETEQIPNAVLEAMAVGLPIASRDVGDIRAMVAPSNRPYIVVREGIEALVLAMRQLAYDAPLRYRIGMDNRLQVERNFGQEQMFREYEKLLLGSLEPIVT